MHSGFFVNRADAADNGNIRPVYRTAVFVIPVCDLLAGFRVKAEISQSDHVFIVHAFVRQCIAQLGAEQKTRVFAVALQLVSLSVPVECHPCDRLVEVQAVQQQEIMTAAADDFIAEFLINGV